MPEDAPNTLTGFAARQKWVRWGSAASAELGKKLAAEIVSRLAARIDRALAGQPVSEKPGDSPEP